MRKLIKEKGNYFTNVQRNESHSYTVLGSFSKDDLFRFDLTITFA